MRVYIAGPMSGLPDLNKPAFNRAATMWAIHGHDVVNPADNGLPDSAEWHEHMRADIAGLLTCEAIALLPGWAASRGASLEHDIASRLGMHIFDAMRVEPCEPAPLVQGGQGRESIKA